jgi:hypothetical protein
MSSLVQFAFIPVLLTIVNFASQAHASKPSSKAWVRVTLVEPANTPWQVDINVIPAGNAKPSDLYVGQSVGARQADAKPQAAGQSTPWIDLEGALGKGVASVRFVFGDGKQPLRGVRARFAVATAANESSIVRTITDSDPGNVISLRIPADLENDRQWLLSIREDTRRRLTEVKSFKFADGPLPKKIWCVAGFRGKDRFYTDPAITEMDFDIIKTLGMNAFEEENGGQPGELRRMAVARGMDRTTFFWRSVAALPREKDGAVRLDYDALGAFIDRVYRQDIDRARKAHPFGLPRAVVDLMDEPDGAPFGGPEYEQSFRRYCQENHLAPDFFGKASWEQVRPPRFNWWTYFKDRAAIDRGDLHVRRLWYWAARHWNHATARMYAMATQKVQQYAGDIAVGTRVNFGPPWFYDYGTLPRGIDAFEFGKLKGVTLGFNEDWIGLGSPRLPLEINTFLMDWSRAAARPDEPLLGCYITADADRTAVKLRTFACLARNAKILNFYYYGPTYTHFDPWSDNGSMVRGVGELLRDLGQADDILWDGRPPKAEVALLYSKSWPVWKEDDTEHIEQMMAYLALLHAGIPVDIVSDEQVVDGWFDRGKYKVLYVVNESIPAAALAAIEKWVAGGGHLWASGWAGMRDEYNTPTDAWNTMLGVKQRSWHVTGDTKRLGEVLQPADWTRPAFSRVLTTAVAAIDTPTPGLPVKHGRGLVAIASKTVGKEYRDAARIVKRELGQAVLFADDRKRGVYTEFASAAGVRRPATTSVDQLLAWPLWGKDKGVVLLANYTGQPQPNVEVTFDSPLRVHKLRSLRRGEMAFTNEGGQIRATLSVEDVTDILVVE